MKYLALMVGLAILSFSCGGVSNTLVPTNESLDPTGELVFKEDEELQEKLAAVGAETKGNLGVYALLLEEERAVSFNGNERFAIQSVVKLPVVMAIMQQIADGKFTLDQKISFTVDDLVPANQRSPLRDNNPKGGEVTVAELIRLALSESDGTACDVLTRIAGGTSGVQEYIQTFGLAGMDIKRTHKEFAKDWPLQYENWATPEAAVQLLASLWGQKEEYPERVETILKHMYDTKTGPNRIKGLLPPGTPVAHKTGTGGTRNGITSATNDVGIITLPNGKHVALAVFVGDSPSDEKERELAIARVAKAVFDTWSE